MMLNEQVRTSVDKNDCFYGVGPGRGVVTSTGRIILPCYTYEYGKGDGHTSTIYSDDGVTWHRSNNLQNQTSESTVSKPMAGSTCSPATLVCRFHR